ncbi:MAG: chemotaxis protein CheC [Armatimonadota bacterium]
MIKLDRDQVAALKEAGSLGSQHAALALSQLIGERVNIAVIRVEVASSQNFAQLVGGTDMLGAAVYLQVLGDLKGSIFLFFRRKDAVKLIDTLLYEGKDKALMVSEMGVSSLKEVGNILAASYVNALSEIASLRVVLSVPKFVFDWAGYVIEGIFDEMMKEDVKTLSITTEFVESTKQVKGYFVFIPDHESLSKLLDKMKKE